MMDELRRFILREALIAPGNTVTCAVSGGADSMALLWALHGLRESMGFGLRCAHYNHGLRGDADEDEAFVRDFCARHGIEFVCERGNVRADQRNGESLELAARRLRYEFLFRAAQGGLLATAHTADDNLETLLLRLTRGTSPRGLGGIPVRSGSLIRPLLFAERTEIMAFLDAEGIPHREDSTNGTDFCPRNRIRHHVIPLLREENPAVADAALALSQVMREEDAYLSALADDALHRAETPEGYDCAALLALPPVLRRRVLFAILQYSGVEVPTRRHLELLAGLLRSDDPSASADFPGVTLARCYGVLHVQPQSPEPIPTTPLAIPGVTHIPQAGLRIICSEAKIFEKPENTPIQFRLSCDMIKGGVVVRSRMTGDTLTLSGGSRSLKRLMIDKKIPADRRMLVPVLADETGVLAVGGIGADVRRLAGSGERAIQIQIEKEDFEHEW